MPRFFALLLFLAIAPCAGCAFGTRNVNLTYEPPTAGRAAGSQGAIAVARFADARAANPDSGSGAEVGQVRNGFGARTATVDANQDPVVWVGDSLARGLAAEGFRVERVDQPGDAGELPVVTGAVSHIYADMYMSIDAEVKADISVERGGRRLFSTQCEGADSATAWTASADEFQSRLTGAMKEFVSTCVPRLMPYLEARR